MKTLGNFPRRRMPATDVMSSRARLVRENSLSTDDLIYPFLLSTQATQRALAAMPGYCRYTLDDLMPHAEHA